MKRGETIRVLLVEDSEHDAKLLLRELRAGGFDVSSERIDSGQAMQAALESGSWDVIVCDYSIPGFGAPQALELYRRLELDIPFLVVSGAVGDEVAVECMKKGAHDYLLKGNLTRLCEAVRRELREADVRRRRHASEAELEESRRRLLTLMGNLPGMAYRCANTPSWPMSFVSEGAQILTGYSPAELTDGNRLPYSDLIHPEDRKDVWDRVQERVAEGARFVSEYRIVRKDGETRWVWEQGLAIGDDEEGVSILEGFITDVTERKRAEQQLENALEELRLLNERVSAQNVYLREELRTVHPHGDIVSTSLGMKNVLAQAKQVAGTDSTVLVLGETGTGKELLAREIHNSSNRGDGPLVIVNCAAIPPTLVESELFGHEKGAFTGAERRRVGSFEAADTGTVFLDEVGELPTEAQARLLRVLQEHKIERVGGTSPVDVDVRIVAATHRDLEQDIHDGRFRQDLFFRLNVFPITIPPLRDRVDDIEPLVWSFVKEFSSRMGKHIKGISKADMNRLRSYSWPGNVRELRNIVERAMIRAEAEDLRIPLPTMGIARLATAVGDGTLDDVQRRHILAVLQKSGGRIRGNGGAAQILGLKPTTLESRMLKLGIQRPTASDKS